jgi:phage shock protein A
MGILSRLNSLIKSNLNDALSKAENPQKQYDQALRDMEESLGQSKKQVINCIADEKRMLLEAERKHEEVVRWESRAQAAVRASNDNLAREALQQKGRAEEEERELRKNAAAQRGLAEDLKAGLGQLELKIRDAKLRRDTVLARMKIAGVGGKRGGALKDQSAFEAFDRQARSIDELDAQLEAMQALENPNAQAVEQRFRDLEQQAPAGSPVDDELAALKAKLSKK